MQQLIISGNLGRDVTMRYTPDSTPVADFSVAVNVRRGENENTTWYKVVCWRKLAETCTKYLSKGREVTVIGEPSLEVWTDKSSGQARAQIVVTASQVEFHGRAPTQENFEEELPF